MYMCNIVGVFVYSVYTQRDIDTIRLSPLHSDSIKTRTLPHLHRVDSSKGIELCVLNVQ